MADFCTNCVERIFGKGTPPDIDVHKIHDGLKPGYMQTCLCEGCGMRGVAKDDGGSLKAVDQKGDLRDYPLPILKG